MSINPLSSNLVNLLSNEPISSGAVTGIGNEDTGSFSDILSASLQTAAELDGADKVSSIELLTGQSDDMSGLLLDAQKAEISLNLAIQIRNKVVDAYNQMMNMQV